MHPCSWNVICHFWLVLLIDSGEKTHLDTLNSNFDKKTFKGKKINAPIADNCQSENCQLRELPPKTTAIRRTAITGNCHEGDRNPVNRHLSHIQFFELFPLNQNIFMSVQILICLGLFNISTAKTLIFFPAKTLRHIFASYSFHALIKERESLLALTLNNFIQINGSCSKWQLSVQGGGCLGGSRPGWRLSWVAIVLGGNCPEWKLF